MVGNYKITIYAADGRVFRKFYFENVRVRTEDGCIKVVDYTNTRLFLLIHASERYTVIVEYEENQREKNQRTVTTIRGY